MNEDKVSSFCERIMYAKKWMPSPTWIIILALLHPSVYSGFLTDFPNWIIDFTETTLYFSFLWLIIFVIIMQKKDR